MSLSADVASQTVAFCSVGGVGSRCSRRLPWRVGRPQRRRLPCRPGCAQSGRNVACTYSSGSNPFTVPAGVTSIHVVAVGGKGAGNSGGAGAVVSGDLSVSSGSTLFAVVGANGGGQTPGGAGGGTGATDMNGISDTFGGDGGGASDVRSSANDLATRRLVAGGGGGGGGFGLAQVGAQQFFTRGAGEAPRAAAASALRAPPAVVVAAAVAAPAAAQAARQAAPASRSSRLRNSR
jgi:hypothetical protein